MSRAHEYQYELERQRRQELFNQRVSATTETFYQRYEEQYERMQREGFQDYIPEEMNRLRNDLNSIESLLRSNPVRAREISFQVGSYIYQMNSVASEAIQQYGREERLRREQLAEERKQNQSDLLNLYYDIIQKVKNPITRNFARPELEKLKAEIVAGSSLKNMQMSEAQASITRRAAAVIASAEKKTAEWKAAKQAECVQNSQLEQVEAMARDAQQIKVEDTQKTDEILRQIAALKQKVAAQNLNDAQMAAEIQNVNEAMDEAVITESVRKEAVKAIVKQLRTQEFQVEAPVLIPQENGNYVKIVAKKPSGKRAECRVDLQGKIRYKFDSYEGMACLKDIEQFNVDLQQIYDVKLSEERVLWENPNRISKDERPMGNNDRRKG